VRLDVRDVAGSLELRWFEVLKARSSAAMSVRGGSWLVLQPPGRGHWVAVLRRVAR